MSSTPLDCVHDWRQSGAGQSAYLSAAEVFAQPAYRAHCFWACGLAWAIGLTALLCDYLQSSKAVIVQMHALFAVVSCLAVGRLLLPAYRSSEHLSRRESYLFVRWVSRWVYVFTYLLAAVRVSLFWYEASRATTLNGPVLVRPMDDFQFYALCCLAPLWLLRAILLCRSLNFDRHSQNVTQAANDLPPGVV